MLGDVRDGFRFRGGSLALDFTATLAARRCAPRTAGRSTGTPRWCAMSGCGNKAKVATFRERNRAE